MDFYGNEGNTNKRPDLMASKSGNPFVVPEGYFEDLKSSIISRLAIETDRDSESVFVLPDNYFEELSSQIKTAVALEKNQEHFKSNPFTVPKNYFEELRNTSLANVRDDNEILNIQTPIRRIKRWPIYLAAASLAVVLGFRIFFNTPSDKIETQMAEIPAEDIVNYLQLYSDAGDASLIITSLDESEIDFDRNQVSEADIENYLELNL